MKTKCFTLILMAAVLVLLSFSNDADTQGSASNQIRFTEIPIDFTKHLKIHQKKDAVFSTSGLQLQHTAAEALVISEPIQIPIKNPEPFLAVNGLWTLENGDANKVSVAIRWFSDGKWTKWKRLNIDEELPAPPGQFYSSLLFLPKDVEAIQWRIKIKRDVGANPSVKNLTLRFISPGKIPEMPQVSQLEEFSENAVSRPNVISRTQWGCTDGQKSPLWPPRYTTVKHLIVHHTDTANTSSNWPGVVLAIWKDHYNRRNLDGSYWRDIGYNYLIDPNGLVYEGRAGGDNVQGAHFSCMNPGTMGVAMLGRFITVSPTLQARSTLERLLAWKADQRGIDPLGSTFHQASQLVLPNIPGHSNGNSSSFTCTTTQCPGGNLYGQLPSIRSSVKNLISGGNSNCNIPVGQAAPNPQIFLDAFNRHGGHPSIGCPINTAHRWGRGWIQDFRNGSAGDAALMVSDQNPSTAYLMFGGIWNHYKSLGGATGFLGYPTSDEIEATPSPYATTGRYQRFETGVIHWIRNGSRANLTTETHGAIGDVYRQQGGSGSRCGFPIRNEYIASTGYPRSDFEGCFITTPDGINYQTYYPSNNSNKVEVRIFNGDDRGYVYVNGNQKLSAGYQQDTGWNDITSSLRSGSNKIEFYQYNDLGGWTYAFQVRENGRITFDQSCGQAGSVGCRSNDSTTGLVYYASYNVTMP